jgi:hypothetical protein
VPHTGLGEYCRQIERYGREDEIPLPPKHTEGGIWVAIDSTGIKVADRGEWLREKWHRRRGWLKLEHGSRH